MQISTDFHSGSIEVIDISDRNNIKLKLKKDNKSCTRQWFSFKLTTVVNKHHRIKIINAGESSFADGWFDYQVVASYDQINWFTIPTHYNGKELEFSFKSEQENISFSYYTPYDSLRQDQLLSKLVEKKFCKVSVLGKTNDAQDINLLTIGDESAHKQKVWIIAGQHPGETMAQWFVEGLINRLVSLDPIAIELLTSSVFYVVPNMNPDGNSRGNHRTNGVGTNLNRVWDNPSINDSPEVFYVRQEMKRKGVDLFLDVHGDEIIPVSFIMGSGQSDKLKVKVDKFKNQFLKANSDFQIEYDYDTYQVSSESACCGTQCSGTNRLAKATDFVANEFGCLSLLLEMPFKQPPSPSRGFSHNPQQICLGLGYSVLEPILSTINENNEKIKLKIN